ncbi:MAG: hypothetical protein KA310_03600 [Pseudomonadales bacterium]|nr:hypothetical protein [Pseudomonadales bacterium]
MTELDELKRVADFARKLMAPLPEGNRALADLYFWARFDALGRAVNRLNHVQMMAALKRTPLVWVKIPDPSGSP